MGDKRKYYQDEKLEKALKAVCPAIDNKSGIYFFIRRGEKNYAYIGKASNLLHRTIAHIKGHEQHIDLSIKTRGLATPLNPKGWELNVLHFPKEQLDEKERYFIEMYRNAGFELYNIESGGMDGKTDINERKPSRGYQDGLKQGRKNTQRFVAKLFEKNLTYGINGTPNKNKEKSLAKFENFLKGENEDGRK